MRHRAVLLSTLVAGGCTPSVGAGVPTQPGSHPIAWQVDAQPVVEVEALDPAEIDPLADTAIAVVEAPLEPPTIELVPERPLSSEDLNLVFPKGVDDDVDVVITWTVDGQPWREGNNAQATTVPEYLMERGQTWQVEVTAVDGDRTSAITRAEAAVRNTPPVVANVQTDPPIARTDDDLAVRFDCLDADGDATIATVRWTLNGALQIAGAQEAFVPATLTEPGDVWLVEVWCHDGHDRSVDALTAYLTIL